MSNFILKTPTKPTRGITLWGKVFSAFLWSLWKIMDVFKGKVWQYPPVGFHDDPLYFKASDINYFGYKYYYRTLEKAEKESGLEDYFLSQDFTFKEEPENATTITLSAGGDLMPYDWITPASTKNLWDETGDFFFGSDIVFANLETPVDVSKPSSVTPEVMLNDMYFNASEELFDIFNGNGKYRGLDIVSTANNHMLDLGEEGVAATLNFLKGKKVRPVGSALSKAEQENFPVIERQGIKVAFLAYTYSLNKLRPIPGKEHLTNYIRLNEPGADISLIKHHAQTARQRGADFIVCSLHCGCAYQAYPSSHTVDVYHRVFEEAGVDVILGHHPHNPQPMEQYSFTDPFTGKQKTGFAAYSLGDFIAYDLNIFCRMPLLLKLDITKTGDDTFVSGLKILPAFIAGKKTNSGFDLRLLDFTNIAANNFNHPFFDADLKKEAQVLHKFLADHVLPPQHQKWAASMKPEYPVNLHL